MIEYPIPEQKLRAAGASVVVLDGGNAGEPKSRRRKAAVCPDQHHTIMATVFPPIRWIVPGYVAEGLSILAGRQKLGKTWLAIDWASRRLRRHRHGLDRLRAG